MQAAASCIADKINRAVPSANYTIPSATVRTEAYQNHLLAVWNKSKEIMKKVVTDDGVQACAAVIADTNHEMGHHGITSLPSSRGKQAPHVERRAIDIPEDVVDALKGQVTTITTMSILPGCLSCTIVITNDVQDYMRSATVNPPACDSRLRWGGRFTPIDNVHFQLP